MNKRFEQTLVLHCAATLAGHKCGSLFSYRLSPGEEPEELLRAVNPSLNPKGVRARFLRRRDGSALAYVYRPQRLEKRLAEEEIRRFLAPRGYGCDGEECLRVLSSRVQESDEFPHEIGIFLDYPLEDVVGFIENRGCNFSCSGCWKAYGDARRAEKRFALYRKCREVYGRRYAQGFDVARLTVAA